MSSELIGELGQVVGMGVDGGLVHSEVVVMGEDMVVPSGTAVVYEENIPGVINKSYITISSASQDTTNIEQEDVEYSDTTTADVGATVTAEVVPTEMETSTEVITDGGVEEKKIRKVTLKVSGSTANRRSIEELVCNENNVIVKKENYESINTHESINVEQQSNKEVITNDNNFQLVGKSYAKEADPGTATRRGGPGPSTRHSQRYRKAWEQFSEFSDWLTSHNNVYRAVCKFCNKILLADFTVIKAHAISRKHLYVTEKMASARQAGLEYVFLDEIQEGYLLNTGVSATISTSAGENKEDCERKLLDANTTKGNSGTAGAGSQGYAHSVDNSESSYATGVYVPQQRNPGPPVQMMTKAVVMSPAPNWKATAIVNGHVTRLDLSDYIGRYLILVFYPQDFSKICASEINALSDRAYGFRAIQTEIVACSVDSHLAHLTWSKLSRADGGVSLPKIPLLADPTHTIAKAYGVMLPDKGHTLRAHFIIDKRGILRHMSVTDTLVGRGTDELFRLVRALQYVDEVEEGVPSDWTPPND